jgi:hypothetical protein
MADADGANPALGDFDLPLGQDAIFQNDGAVAEK